MQPSLVEQERCKHGVQYSLLVQLTEEQLKELGHVDCWQGNQRKKNMIVSECPAVTSMKKWL